MMFSIFMSVVSFICQLRLVSLKVLLDSFYGYLSSDCYQRA